MPDKKPSAPKIIDVTGPNQTAPSPTSRPVVLTHRPVLTNDPMMVEQAAAPETVGLPTAPMVSRQARTIAPITPGQEEPSEPLETLSTPTETDNTVLPGDGNDVEAEPVEGTASPANQETPSNKTEVATQPDDPDPKAEVAPETVVAAEEEPETLPTEEETAAKKSASDEKQLEEDTARQQELESLIVSGKYAVPINAVQRKRSRMTVAALTFLAVILAVVLFDAALDSSVISLPSVPHTHFFQTK